MSVRSATSTNGRVDIDMRTLIGWLTAFIAGSAGWWLGSKVGLGTAVVLGAVATGVGLYAGYRWFDQNLK